MIHTSDDDARAIREQLRRVQTLATAAAGASDTENMDRALWGLSLAVLDARALVRAVEDNIRNSIEAPRRAS